jgi:hypothetical protein
MDLNLNDIIWHLKLKLQYVNFRLYHLFRMIDFRTTSIWQIFIIPLINIIILGVKDWKCRRCIYALELFQMHDRNRETLLHRPVNTFAHGTRSPLDH